MNGDIFSNLKFTGISRVPIQNWQANKRSYIKPMEYDSFISGNKTDKETENKIFNELMYGDFDKATKLYASANPKSTEEDFQNFHKNLITKRGSSPEILAKGEDIEYDEIKTGKNNAKLFYKNGNLIRKVYSDKDPKTSPSYIIEDYTGPDKDGKSRISIQRNFSYGEFFGFKTEFRDAKHNIIYKSVYNLINEKGNVDYSCDVDNEAFELIDKIEKTIPLYTQSKPLKSPTADTYTPKYLYHITTKENYESAKKAGKLRMGAGDGTISGIFCVDADNFKNQWNENDAWKGNLKEDLIFKQVIGKKNSDDIVVLKIPVDKLDKNKIRIRTEEDFFRSSDICLYGSLLGAKEPECVTKGYDLETGVENFRDDMSLEYIIGENIDVKDLDVVYSGRPERGNISEIVDSMESEADATTIKPTQKSSIEIKENKDSKDISNISSKKTSKYDFIARIINALKNLAKF